MMVSAWWMAVGMLVASFGAYGQVASLEEYLKMAIDDDSSEHGQMPGPKSTNCSCGSTNKARIVAGRKASRNEFPFMAGLKELGKGEIFCGASVLTPQHVLTAAHCTYPLKMFRKFHLAVVVGAHVQSEDEPNRQELAVKRTIEHENYHPRKYFNDIAMVVLEEPISFTQSAGPVCLPSEPLSLVNEQVKVMGWGKLGAGRGTSSVLRKLNIKVIPLEVCKKNFKREILLDPPTQICTIRRNKDSCAGDSGGPLVWLDPETNRYTLVGLVSYGKTLCATGPAVNTDLSAHLDWIQRKIAVTHPEEKTCSKIG
uniref:Venom S1 protease 26 n=1 Tax=Lethocerus distinctifemur TaxID=280095 RepID=A0A2K8JRI5_9HEMI|nr:venom S1 protease 26 [Lethocerus distinctifemur]